MCMWMSMDVCECVHGCATAKQDVPLHYTLLSLLQYTNTDLIALFSTPCYIVWFLGPKRHGKRNPNEFSDVCEALLRVHKESTHRDYDSGSKSSSRWSTRGSKQTEQAMSKVRMASPMGWEVH